MRVPAIHDAKVARTRSALRARAGMKPERVVGRGLAGGRVGGQPCSVGPPDGHGDEQERKAGSDRQDP